MAQYLLATLVDWARRRGGDRLLRQRESLTTDGTAVLLLNNDGNIVIQSCKLGGLDQIINSDFTIEANALTFDPVPAADVPAVIVYDNSKYTNNEIQSFVSDAAKDINARLKLNLVVDPSGVAVTDANAKFVTADNVMVDDVENLIALKAGLLIREDITNNAASDAISIKDGDTSIDTSKTAAGNETRLKALRTEFTEAFRIAVINHTRGVASDGLHNVGEVV
jgi:hypothetical protein